MSNILRFTIYKSVDSGHGGDKRTAQISEILNEMDLRSEIIPTGMDETSLSRGSLFKLLKTAYFFISVLRYTGWKFKLTRLIRTILLVSRFQGVFEIRVKPEIPIILWESTKVEFSFIIPLFRKLGYKIVAIPHNMESLVPGMISGLSGKKKPDWLEEEINIFRNCDIVFAISKEETFLLNTCGVQTIYLPYYPTLPTQNKLIEIRNKRERTNFPKNKPPSILMLGSIVNAPTKEGMKDRIDFFNVNLSINCRVLVAGYGTEQFKKMIFKNRKIEILGELSEDSLRDVMIETDLMLVHQPPTSGALSRIIESLIAGIPVLANFHSSRDYFNIHGLSIYYNDQQLVQKLRENRTYTTPEMPVKPDDEIIQFKKYLSELLFPVKV